ncbi:MAG TPA: type IVB secretion system protein IcmH/DotU, partial [Paracoccaceae bacterium]|nr:type IVB secretion system protein IcmH/DotU [Paracoccaceae bacterium]
GGCDMSNDPFDPFGQNERTIIRPQPGGRPAAPQPASRPGTPAHGMQGGSRQQVQAPTGRPVESVRTPGSNPLIVAAGPLLDLLGRLRNAQTQARFADLKQSVSRYIEGFEKAATEAGAYPEQLRTAKYALAATADDIVQNLPGDDRHVWTQDPMLGRYFGERIGGTRFFDHLAEAMKNPGANYDLLELKYACLALGFEGMHRSSPQGQSALQTIRRDVYQALRGVAAGGGWALSPRWTGMDVGRRTIGRQIPFWAVAAVCALLLVGVFFGLRMSLASDSQQLAQEILSIHPDENIEIARASFVTPPPPPPPPPAEAIDHGQLERIRMALKPEIDAGLISADYLDANFIIVRMSNELLFPSGSAEVGDDFEALATRIGEVFTAETELLRQKGFKHGRVVALGHSDAQPVSATSRGSSNLELSKARAESVLNAVLRHSPPDLRTQVEGRGPNDPVCTPAEDRACWPQNRRVELLIERTH